MSRPAEVGSANAHIGTAELLGFPVVTGERSAVLKALLERKLLKILGRKEEPGRPILYGTTREFLEFFAVKDLASLPTLREFHELNQEHRDLVERERPAGEPPRFDGLVAELADPALRCAAPRS